MKEKWQMQNTHLKNVLQGADKNCIQIFCHEFVQLREATAQDREGEKTEGSEKASCQNSGKSRIKNKIVPEMKTTLETAREGTNASEYSKGQGHKLERQARQTANAGRKW